MILRIAIGTLSFLLLAIAGVCILASLLIVPDFEVGNEDRYAPWLAFIASAVLVSLACVSNLHRCLADLRIRRSSLAAQGLAFAITASMTVGMWLFDDLDAEGFSVLSGLLAVNLLLSAMQRRQLRAALP